MCLSAFADHVFRCCSVEGALLGLERDFGKLPHQSGCALSVLNTFQAPLWYCRGLVECRQLRGESVPKGGVESGAGE